MNCTTTTCTTCKNAAFHNGKVWTHDNSLKDLDHKPTPTARALATQAKKEAK